MDSMLALTGTFSCSYDRFLTLDTSTLNISQIIGYSSEEIEAEFQNQFINLIFPDDRELVLTQTKKQLETSDVVELTFRLFHKNGHIIWVLAKGQVIAKENGSNSIAGVLIDITKTKELHATTSKAFEQYKIILSQTENIIFELDVQTDTIVFSESWKKIFGYKLLTVHFSSDTSALSAIHPDDFAVFREKLQILFSGAAYQTTEARIQKTDGIYLWTRIRATAIYDDDDNISKIVGIIIIIDDEKRKTNALRKRAEQDALTKLLNHDTARKRSENFFASNPGNVISSLLIIDLDDFKKINDYYGHLYGDEVLIKTADEIKRLFRPEDIVARIGGDEYLVLIKNVSSSSLVKKRCSQLIQSLHSIFKNSSPALDSSCSIGIAFSPEHGITYNDLFQHADQALYRAKALGKSCYVIYDENNF